VERAAQNQTIFRAGNEAMRSNLRMDGAAIPFMCECSDPGCFESVPLAHDEYERLRAHPRRFFVLPGHEDRGEEPFRIVERTAGFVVMEKLDGAGQIAEESDPRGDTA
jgi:hypothetical protein